MSKPYVQFPVGYTPPPKRVLTLMYDVFGKKAHTIPTVQEPRKIYSGSGNIGSYCCSYCGHRSSTCMYAMQHKCVADEYYDSLSQCTKYEVTNERSLIVVKHKALIKEGTDFVLNPNNTITLIGNSIKERVYARY